MAKIIREHTKLTPQQAFEYNQALQEFRDLRASCEPGTVKFATVFALQPGMWQAGRDMPWDESIAAVRKYVAEAKAAVESL